MSDAEFQEIEHTADWALRVRGDDLPSLFQAAARGMFSLLTDLTQVANTSRETVELEALDLETLLIDWLNELLYRVEGTNVVYTHFAIEDLDAGASGSTKPAEQATPAKLRATVGGGPAPTLDKTIKAATFSGLHITRNKHGYTTEIVFDV